MGFSPWERVRFWDFFLVPELKGTELEYQQKSSVLRDRFCTPSPSMVLDEDAVGTS